MHKSPLPRLALFVALVALPALATGMAACKKKPCKGKINKEPLPASWGLGSKVPEGNYQCKVYGAKDSGELRRFEMPGKKPEDALHFWDKLLTSKGWRLVGGEPSNSGKYERIYRYQGPLAQSRGAKIRFTVSKRLKNKGWVTIERIRDDK